VITFYRTARVVVTADRLIVETPVRQVHELRHLHNLRTVKRRVNPLVLSASISAAVLAAAAVAMWQALPTASVVAAGAAVVSIGLAVAWSRRRPRQLELWADYRDVPLLVFATPDEREFGQVCRAVVRALEHAVMRNPTIDR